MDLKDVYQAYIELTDFKTTNFKPYVPRRQSPALGLLLSLKLLKKKNHYVPRITNPSLQLAQRKTQ